MDIKNGNMNMDMAWELPWKSWDMMKKNYPLALGLGVLFVAIALLQNIPFIGILVYEPLSIIWLVGILYVAKDWENGHPSSFDQFIKNISNKDQFKPILPLIVASTIVGFIKFQFVTFGAGLGSLSLVSIVGFIFTFTIHMMVCQMILAPGMTLEKSFNNYKNAIAANLLPVILAWIFIALLGSISMILFVLPFLFIFIPAALSVNYLFYRILFEGLEIKSEELKL